MTGLPFDPDHPPEEPPPEVVHPLMWRMAVRLLHDHRPRWAAPVGQAQPACRTCAQPWPCRGRRLGERGLRAALPEPPGGTGTGREGHRWPG